MKTNEYITPAIEIIDIECEGTLCASTTNPRVRIYDEDYEDDWD